MTDTPAQLIAARIRTAHRAQPYRNVHFYAERGDGPHRLIDTVAAVTAPHPAQPSRYVHPALVGVSEEDF